MLKFGGSSIASPLHVLKVIEAKNNVKLLIVLSALKGVTDKLIDLADKLKSHEFDSARNLKNEVVEIHKNSWGDQLSKKHFEFIEDDIEKYLKAAVLLKEQSEQARNKLISRGEVYSCYLLSELLANNKVKSELIKAERLLNRINSDFIIDSDTILESIRRSDILITQGFVYSENKKLKLMERGGSDFTASFLAKSIDAINLEIWTDVDGLFSADPNKFDNTELIQKIGFKQFIELSRFGAKLLYPESIFPAIESGIEVQIKNTFNPETGGTEITKESQNQISISYDEGYRLIKLDKDKINKYLRLFLNIESKDQNNYEILTVNNSIFLLIKGFNHLKSFFDYQDEDYSILVISGNHEKLDFEELSIEYIIMNNNDRISKYILSKHLSNNELQNIHNFLIKEI